MNENSVACQLMDLLFGCEFDCTEFPENVKRVVSYEKGGYLTYDSGFVIKMKDGTEFQVTVTQSR